VSISGYHARTFETTFPSPITTHHNTLLQMICLEAELWRHHETTFIFATINQLVLVIIQVLLARPPNAREVTPTRHPYRVYHKYWHGCLERVQMTSKRYGTSSVVCSKILSLSCTTSLGPSPATVTNAKTSFYGIVLHYESKSQ
jgi:hypothetical protein